MLFCARGLNETSGDPNLASGSPNFVLFLWFLASVFSFLAQELPETAESGPGIVKIEFPMPFYARASGEVRRPRSHAREPKIGLPENR